MKVKIIILLLFYFIIPISKNCLAISQTQNLLITATISSKSKIIIDRTDITLSNDPEINTNILTDSINIISKTKTGKLSENNLEASTELLNNSGDIIILSRSLYSSINKSDEISWKKADRTLFQGDVWDTLIMHLNYQNNAPGPYSAVLKYTLITP
jgi:hypothetical protein